VRNGKEIVREYKSKKTSLMAARFLYCSLIILSSCIEPRLVGRQHLLRFSMPFKDICTTIIAENICRPLFSSITNYYGQNALKRRINNISTTIFLVVVVVFTAIYNVYCGFYSSNTFTRNIIFLVYTLSTDPREGIRKKKRTLVTLEIFSVWIGIGMDESWGWAALALICGPS
jgi:hypothetical protein